MNIGGGNDWEVGVRSVCRAIFNHARPAAIDWRDLAIMRLDRAVLVSGTGRAGDVGFDECRAEIKLSGCLGIAWDRAGGYE
jgi:hypothetical protein